MVMKLPIPNDWNGDDWSCVQLYWPNSTLWRIILMGLISAPTQGRLWDEKTGSILATQVIANEIYSRNNPFNSCEGDDCPSPTENIVYKIIASLCDDSEGEMAVQKVWVDCETAELVVDYGGCDGECRYDLSCIVTDKPGVPDGYEPPGGGNDQDEYSACGKAYAVTEAIFDLAKSFWDHCDDVTIFPFKAIQNENPDIKLSGAWKWVVKTEAFVLQKALGALGYDWEDLEEYKPKYLCLTEQLFTDTAANDLADGDIWDSFKGIYWGPGFFGRITDPAIGPFFNDLVTGVIGREQLGEILVSNAGDLTQDCECPDDILPDIPPEFGFGWSHVWDFKNGTGYDGITFTFENGGEIVAGKGFGDSIPAENGLINPILKAPVAPPGGKQQYVKIWIRATAPEDGGIQMRQCDWYQPTVGIFIELDAVVEEFPTSKLYVGTALNPTGYTLTDAQWWQIGLEAYLHYKGGETPVGEMWIEKVAFAGMTGPDPFPET